MRQIILLFILIVFNSCSKEDEIDAAALKMQKFVIDISLYARNIDPDFVIIPQNGIELAYIETDPSQGLHTEYLSAINGFGVEELFYDGQLAVDLERLDMLRELVQFKKVMVADYVSDDQDIADDISRNLAEDFICFPRRNDNYDYSHIPNSVVKENSSDITSLGQAQNYLYLISTDLFSSKQQLLESIKSTNYDLLLIDLFFEEIELTYDEIQQLKTKANGGKRLIISYMNIGAAEIYRYYWQDSWKLHHPDWIRKRYEGYEEEYWIEFWNPEWQNIIFGNEDSYVKKVLDAGFDGIFLDNVEVYYFLYHS